MLTLSLTPLKIQLILTPTLTLTLTVTLIGGISTVLCMDGPSNPNPDPNGRNVDCAVHGWGGWGTCSISCGGVAHTASQTVAVT